MKLAIGVRKVDLKALDAAYSIVFPNYTPINVNKKRKTTPKNPTPNPTLTPLVKSLENFEVF